MKYRADIDGLRALAVCMVIVFHVQPSLPMNGYMGVDIFFVISGFLITSIIGKEIEQGVFSVKGFYERRIRRIFPALFAVTLFSLILGWLTFLPEEMISLGKSAIASTLFTSNILFWLQSGYFSMDAELKPLLHTWSLSIEEQFYIVLPLLLLLLHRYKVLNTLFIIVLLWCMSFFANIYYVYTGHAETSFYWIHARSWELLTGSILALRLVQGPRSRWTGEIISTIGACLLIAGAFLPFDENSFPGYAALFPVIGSALIIFAGIVRQDIWVNRICSFKPAVFVGKISYSLYLWHWPLLVFTSYIMLDYIPPFLRLLLIIVIFIAGYFPAILYFVLWYQFYVCRALPFFETNGLQ